MQSKNPSGKTTIRNKQAATGEMQAERVEILRWRPANLAAFDEARNSVVAEASAATDS